MIYTHYLITRFNIVQRWFSNCQRYNNSYQTDEWLRCRVELFENLTLPSLQNQSCQCYKWIILFNSESPLWFQNIINKWVESYCNIVPLFLEPEGDERALLIDYIQKHTQSEYVITTRCDSDDLVHKDFVARIQKDFEYNRSDVFLNYTHGLQYSTTIKCGFDWPNFPANHFASRQERTSECKTVICDHTTIHQHPNYREISSLHPMWIEIVHASNAANIIQPLRPTRINISDYLPHFKKDILPFSFRAYLKQLLYYHLHKYIHRAKDIYHKLMGLKKVHINSQY